MPRSRKVDHVAGVTPLGTNMVSVRMTTELGDIELDLRRDRAPASTAYFLGDVSAGLYDGSSFFRIVTRANQSAEEGRRLEAIQGGLKHTRDDLPPVVP
ncbi:MAG: peptidylprolyl isomerase, partial [Dongiaceae bacterium]